MVNSNRMIHRHSSKNSKDFHGTPAHATHRIIMAGIKDGWLSERHTVSEPCAGKGDMVDVLRQYFDRVVPSDIKDYGRNYRKVDYLDLKARFRPTRWTFINPPYNKKEAFLQRAMKLSDLGVAMFLNTGFVSGQSRYHRIFIDNAPSFMYQFPDRVGSVKSPGGYLLHAWFVWLKPYSGIETTLRWLGKSWT